MLQWPQCSIQASSPSSANTQRPRPLHYPFLSPAECVLVCRSPLPLCFSLPSCVVCVACLCMLCPHCSLLRCPHCALHACLLDCLRDAGTDAPKQHMHMHT